MAQINNKVIRTPYNQRFLHGTAVLINSSARAVVGQGKLPGTIQRSGARPDIIPINGYTNKTNPKPIISTVLRQPLAGK